MNRDDALAVLGMAEFASQSLDRADAEPWLERLAEQEDRLHEGLRFFLSEEEGQLALRMAVALFPYWRDRGLTADGRAWLSEALEAPGSEIACELRAKALTGAAVLAFRQGHDDRAQDLNEEALRVARDCGERLAEAGALLGLARVSFRTGDHAAVRTNCEASLRIAEEVGDLESQASPLHLLAESWRLQGDLGRARDLYGASLDVARAIGDDRMISLELHNLAYVDLHDGAIDLAAQGFRDSMVMARRRGDVTHVAYCVLGLGVVIAELGGWERAVELLGKADSLLERVGETLDPAEAAERERVVAKACEVLGQEACDAARARGASLSLADALGKSFRDMALFSAVED